MKLYFFLILIIFHTVFAYTQELSLIKNATLNILVNDTRIANRELNKIISNFKLTIEKTDINNSKQISEYELHSKNLTFFNVITEIEKLGATDLKIIETFNYKNSLAGNNYDLQYLQEQKEIITKEIENIYDKSNELYKELFNKERELDKQIYEKNKEIRSLNDKINFSVITLKFYEKTIQDLDTKDDFFIFINMPGIETKYFHLENKDTPNIENDYFGGSLRYMFTKGRAYFLIGIMKPVKGESSSNMVNDIVTYSFGKDFYPRYFGQGKNTFFNPFSGFEIGGIILTSEHLIEHIFMLEPHIGLEIFKNQYVIVDTRIGYTFPLDEKKIKSHRGFTHNLSVNIVF